MALVESTSISLGSPMPQFALKDPYQKIHDIDSLMGQKGLLINFTCNHCPYAIAVWQRFIRLSHFAKQGGIHTVAINPNINPDYPEDSPERMIDKIKEWNIPFPYLVDETQKVAQLYDAQCTPDIYLLNQNKELVYHGRIDDNWKDESQVQKEELKAALEQLMKDQEIQTDQKPSMGCSIKWNRS